MANNNSRFRHADINITQSINTDGVGQDIYQYGDNSVPLLKNNGIERDGGVTNVWEVENNLSPNSSTFVTPEGDQITKQWDGLVKLRGVSLGYVSPYNVQDMCSVKQVDDVMLSAGAKTYITAALIGNTIELFEYDIASTPVSGQPFGENEVTFDSAPPVGLFASPTIFPNGSLYPSSVGAALHTRSIALTIPGIPNISSVYTSLSIVRSSTESWSSSLEFIIRVDTLVYKITEAAPAAPIGFANLLLGFNQLNYIYTYRYETGTDYLVNMVGNNQNKSFIVTNWGTSAKTDIRCRYAVPQTSLGYTRHLVTCDPLTDATRTASTGYVGHLAFTSTFTASVTWSTLSNTYTSTTYTQPTYFNTGFGYSEYIVKTTASNNWTNVHTPNFITDNAQDDHATQTNDLDTLWNYYGKLNNFGGIAPTRQLEFRIGWLNGTQSFLSVAPLDSTSASPGTNDRLGVLLTELGALDDSFQPQLMSDNTILYKANDNFYVVAIDYDYGAGYFNKSDWSDVSFTGASTLYISGGILDTVSSTTSPAATITLQTPLQGGQYKYLSIRYKTEDPTDIIIQHSNSQHSYSSTYQKTFTPTADGEWHTKIVNMSSGDYVAYNVTGIKIIMGSTIGAAWSLYSVFIAYKQIVFVPQVQRISDAAYKLNTIDPLNIVNIRTGLLEPGSVDYNGRLAFSYTGVPATVPYRVTANINSIFSNSLDTGEKIVNCDLAVSNPSTVITPIGTRLIGSLAYSVDIYASPTSSPASLPLYSFSVKESGTELVDPVKVDYPYQSNLVLPIPMGYRYKEFAVYARSSTIFYNTTNPVSIGNLLIGTSVGYDGYTLGNDIKGTYIPFFLNGNRYIQDLTNLYIIQFQNDIFTSKEQIAPSIGMNYVGSSPNLVYFLSTFDNSLYTFDGNRTLNKFKRLNQIAFIENGQYSTKDNTLALSTQNSFLWIRDGVVTQNTKKVNQDGAIYMFDTRDGLVLMNQYYYWSYTYNQLNFGGPFELVPLEWQSAHFGSDKNMKSILQEVVFTVLNTDPTKKLEFNVTIYSKDESDNYKQQRRNIVLWPKDYNERGYVTFAVKPESYKAVASSFYLQQIGLDPPKIVLLDVVANVQQDTNAVLAPRKRR